MKLILPEAVTDSVLDATNVAETLAEYNAATVYYYGQKVRDDTAHRAYESLIGVAPATVTITIASPGVVTQNSHGLENGATVAFSTTGALPTGVVAGTVYYVINKTDNTYEISATSGGSAINTSGGQSGVHSVISNPNKGFALTDATKWLDLGPTNPWAMFDNIIGTNTTNADTIEVTLTPIGRARAMALFNLEAASVSVTVTDATDGLVYDETFSLVSNDNVGNYYDYCFEPIIRRSDLFIEGLPPYVGPDIEVTIDNTGSTAQCGNLVFGSLRTLGVTVYGSGFGIIDYSRKVADENFGTVTLVERDYRSTARLDVVVDHLLVDEVKRVLASRRAIPTVYAGTGEYSATLIYGFPRDWSVSIDQPLHSKLAIELESLT